MAEMMKQLKMTFFTLIAGCLLTSCASIINSILGIDECEYQGCDRQKAKDCNYCSFHCDSHYLPEDFNKKIDSSTREQMDRYRKGEKMMKENKIVK